MCALMGHFAWMAPIDVWPHRVRRVERHGAREAAAFVRMGRRHTHTISYVCLRLARRTHFLRSRAKMYLFFGERGRFGGGEDTKLTRARYVQLTIGQMART